MVSACRSKDNWITCTQLPVTHIHRPTTTCTHTPTPPHIDQRSVTSAPPPPSHPHPLPSRTQTNVPLLQHPHRPHTPTPYPPAHRPTFRYFSTPTALGGLAGAMIMCFVISMVYASVALLCCLLLVIVLHLRDYPRSWGSISQAIIFHQVFHYPLPTSYHPFVVKLLFT